MDAPHGIRQPTLWAAYLETFAESDLSKQDADRKLAEIAKNIPAIFREINDSSQSMLNLQKAFKNNKKLKSAIQYKAVVTYFNLLKEDCLPYDPKEFLEKPAESHDPLAITDTEDFDHGCQGNPERLGSYLNAYLDQILYSNVPIHNGTFSTICHFLGESIESPFCANKTAILNVIYKWLEQLFTCYSLPKKNVFSKLIILVLSHPQFNGVSSAKLWKKVDLSLFTQSNLVKALLRDMNEIAPLLVHHREFQQKMAYALQSIYSNYMTKLTTVMMFQPPARKFFCDYAQLCLSIWNLHPRVVPQQIQDFLFKWEDKLDILKTCQLLLLDSLDERHSEWIRVSNAFIGDIFSSTKSQAFPTFLKELLAALAQVPSNVKKDYTIVSILIAKACALKDASLSKEFLNAIYAAFDDLHMEKGEIIDDGFIDVIQPPKLVEDEFVLMSKMIPSIRLTMTNAAIDPGRLECLAGLNISKIRFLKITPEIAALKKKFPQTLFVYEQKEESFGDKFLSLFGVK